MPTNIKWEQGKGDPSRIANVPSAALGPDGLCSVRVPFGQVTIPFVNVAIEAFAVTDFRPIVGIEIVGCDQATDCGNYRFYVNTCLSRISWWLEGYSRNQSGLVVPPNIHFALKMVSSCGGASEMVTTGTFDGDGTALTWASGGLIKQVEGLLCSRAELWAVVINDVAGNAAVDVVLSCDFDRLGGAFTITDGILVS